MEIIKVTKNIATVNISTQELKILRNALATIQEVLPVKSFQVRVDYSHQRVKEFEELISKLIEQEDVNYSNHQVNVSFDFDETKMFNNALNEICHGVKVPNYELQIGSSWEVVKKLLSTVNKMHKEMYSLKRNN
jgi:hypothetical protein